jgi:hypothetical protein
MVTAQPDPYPHPAPTVDLRRELYEPRSRSSEPFNDVFKAIFGRNSQLPVRGLCPTQLLVLGALFLCQLVLQNQRESNRQVCTGIEPLIRAA